MWLRSGRLCRKLIDVGDRALLADARVMDDFHQMEAMDTWHAKIQEVAKLVSISHDAPTGAGAFVRKGVTIRQRRRRRIRRPAQSPRGGYPRAAVDIPLTGYDDRSYSKAGLSRVPDDLVRTR